MNVIYKPKGRAGEYADLALNLYDGCSYGCPYCYVPGIRRQTRESFRTDVKPRRDIIQRLKKDLSKLEQGSNIFIAFTHDPYQPIEAKLQLTRQAIELIHQAGHYVKILTKAGPELIWHRDYDLFGPKDEIGTTLDPMDEDFRTSDSFRIRSSVVNRFFSEPNKPKLWVSMEPIADTTSAWGILHSPIMAKVDYCYLGPINPLKKSDRAKHLEFIKSVAIHVGAFPYRAELKPKLIYRELLLEESGHSWQDWINAAAEVRKVYPEQPGHVYLPEVFRAKVEKILK